MSNEEYKRLKFTLRTVWVALAANVMVIFGAVWFMSAEHKDIQRNREDIIEMKESCINEIEWKYNDYFTRYLWAERWNQPLPDPPYKTRGAVPNI